MNMNPLHFAALLVSVLGCGGESFAPLPYEVQAGAPVRISVPEGPHRPGTSIPLSLHNQSNAEYLWNPCMRSLERRIDDQWAHVDEGDRWCTLEGWILKEGGHSNASTDTPSFLPAGQYRFRYSFSREQGNFNVSEDQVSNPFSVAP
jgi:hypothetical protein